MRHSRSIGGGQPAFLDAPGVLHLQRLAGNASVATLVNENAEVAASGVRRVIRSGRGQPLDDSTRMLMEERFGQDFGPVRVHADAAATDSARSIGAHAYTVGNDIVFQSQLWDPHTDAGKRMLAHELAHVIQQRAGPVSGRTLAGGIRISDPHDQSERDADLAAGEVMRERDPASGSARVR